MRPIKIIRKKNNDDDEAFRLEQNVKARGQLQDRQNKEPQSVEEYFTPKGEIK